MTKWIFAIALLASLASLNFGCRAEGEIGENAARVVNLR